MHGMESLRARLLGPAPAALARQRRIAMIGILLVTVVGGVLLERYGADMFVPLLVVAGLLRALLSLQLPLFQQGQSQRARATALRDIARERLAIVQLQVQQQVRSGLVRLDTQRAIIDTFRDALIPQREAIVAREQERYNFMLIGVFENILRNALHYTPQGGAIALDLNYLASEQHYIVNICDSGPGVPEDLVPYLFDPFVTTKRSGSGLGLAMVAKIVGDHGGIVECDSQPRRTTFRVLMPMYNAAGGEPVAKPEGRHAER